MEDEIHVLCGLLYGAEIAEVAFCQFERGMGKEAGDIFPFAGGEVVEHPDEMALGEEAFGDIGADEAGAAGDEEFIHTAYY